MKVGNPKSEFEILDIEQPDGLVINHKNTKITFYDSFLIEEFVNKYFEKKYRDLLLIIMDLNNSSDSSESDEMLVRSKIENLEIHLQNKYGSFISSKKIAEYLRLLQDLEGKIKVKYNRRGR